MKSLVSQLIVQIFALILWIAGFLIIGFLVPQGWWLDLGLFFILWANNIQIGTSINKIARSAIDRGPTRYFH
jgi:hypothetical protein